MLWLLLTAAQLGEGYPPGAPFRSARCITIITILHFSSRTSINVDHSGNLIAPECHEFKEFGSCKHESLHLLIFWHVLMGTTYINLAPVTSRQFLMTKPQVAQARHLPRCQGGSKHAAIKTQQSNYSVVHLLNAFNQLNSPGTKLGKLLGWLQATNQCFSYSFGVFCICDLKERLMMLY